MVGVEIEAQREGARVQNKAKWPEGQTGTLQLGVTAPALLTIGP